MELLLNLVKFICLFIVLWGFPAPYLDTIVSVAYFVFRYYSFCVSFRHAIMVLYLTAVFIIASNALLFHMEIFYKQKPFLALKRLFPFGTQHLTLVQTCRKCEEKMISLISLF